MITADCVGSYKKVAPSNKCRTNPLKNLISAAMFFQVNTVIEFKFEKKMSFIVLYFTAFLE